MLGLLKRSSLLCGSILFALVLVESAARYRDGDSLVSLRLRTRTPALAPVQWKSGADVMPALLAYVRTIPIRDIDIAWFQVDPPELPRRPVDPALQTRYEEFDRRGVYPPPSFYIWNAELTKEACGSKKDLFRSFPRDVKVFENSDRSPFPAFRFPPNQTLPSGLVTNQFGFRGPALAPRKSAGLIRIAFVGASTTQNVHAYRWSYPELTGSWLNMWLRHQHRPERVEIINAGREGLSARDIREIVKREVVPLEPDYVVYLEGANLVPVPLVKWPGGRAPAVAPVARDRTLRAPLGRLSEYSALAKALVPVVARKLAPSPDEPPKSKYELELPSSDRVTSAELAAVFGEFFRTITENLDEDNRNVKAIDARLVLSSVIRLVHNGLRLDPVSQAVTYEQLNTLSQPLTYTDIRRLVDLQNAMYRIYAADRGIDFIDVAAAFPRDPDLFMDTFHLNMQGVRLHAWLVFLRLTAILERDFDRLRARHTPPAVSVAFPTVVDARLPSCAP